MDNPDDPDKNVKLLTLALAALGQQVSKLQVVLQVLVNQGAAPTPAASSPVTPPTGSPGAPGSPNTPAPKTTPAAPATSPAASNGSLKDGGFAGLFLKAIGKLLTAFVPVIALSAVLGEVTSGMGVFLKSIRLISVMLSAFLLPVFAVFAAALLTAGEGMFEKFKPQLAGFYEFIIRSLKPAAIAFAEILIKLAEVVARVMSIFEPDRSKDYKDLNPIEQKRVDELAQWSKPKWLGGLGGEEARKAGHEINLILNGRRNITEDNIGTIPVPLDYEGIKKPGEGPSLNDAKKALEEFKNGPTPPKDEAKPEPYGKIKPKDKFDENMDLVIRSLRNSLGPPASAKAIAQANRDVQMAALNQDPIEAKILKMGLEIFDKLQEAVTNSRRIADNTERKPVPRYNAPKPDAGDF